MRNLILFLAMSFAWHHFSTGQTTAIKGQLKDAYSNEAIPFANIIIYNTNTGTTSDENGQFELTNLTPGFVQLQISSLGYKTKITEQIMVTKNRTIPVSVELEPTTKEISEIKVTASNKLPTPRP